MNYKKGSFTTVPNKEDLRGKDAIAQVVFVWLCSYADEDGTCFPSRSKLAKDCKVTVDTIDKKIKYLVEEGLIEKTTRKDGELNKSNLYQILLVEEGGVADQDGQGSRLKQGRGSRTNPTLTQSIKNSIQLTPSGVPPQDVAEVIDSFKEINPVAKNWFKNTTQRAASEQLIEIMGTKEKVIHFVSRVLPGINSRKYAPRSTTPHELLNNLAKIKSFVEQEKEKKVGIII